MPQPRPPEYSDFETVVDLEDLYFEWLLTCLDEDGVTEELAYLCGMLHRCDFLRRVGRDINRASEGASLRKEFLEQFSEANFAPNVANELLNMECTWLEMLIGLARDLDYLYDGGVEARFIEMITNLAMDGFLTYRHIATREDQRFVDYVTHSVDRSLFDRDGHGGLFPLRQSDHPDQRKVEIWAQQGAYFRERLEEVLWTSTS